MGLSNSEGFMRTKALSLKEICAIIKTCGENSVAELKFCDLELKFHPSAQSPVASQSPEPQITYISTPTEEPSEEDLEAKRLEEEILEETQRMIEDPESYEADLIKQAMRE